MRYNISIVLTILIAVITLQAQEPPPPQEIASTISNYWATQNFTNLHSYITNLYARHSNYIPAILSASFHDYIFLGKLVDATNKLQIVQQAIVSNPSNYPLDFRILMDEILVTMKWEIDLHSRKGRTAEMIQSNASPQAVWNAAGSTLLQNINILFYSPATNVPSVKPVILDAQVRMKPEALEVSLGILTAFVRLPEGYPVSGITSATCDGAPSERMMPNDDGTEMVIKFRRQDIEKALAQSGQTIDTNFVVRGTWQGTGSTHFFLGVASIKKIVGAKSDKK